MLIVISLSILYKTDRANGSTCGVDVGTTDTPFQIDIWIFVGSAYEQAETKNHWSI